ncbi:MAG: RNA polymerase sigma-70 factor [Tannerellaceae bacterium]|jgi:RNA polymerase sigma-70 factor (ECF subfamily)|nr:RNA polymerase sigma-70 factor [Tannerellaceae bacterium]
MNEPLKEHELLAKFQTLYKQYAPELILFAAKFVDISSAEDFVHDVFLKLWNKRAFLYWEDGMKTYLYHAVRHACLDCLKHREIRDNVENNALLRLKIEELYYAESSNPLWQEDTRLTLVYREIENLPQKCREIFTMAYIEDRKASEIASLLNISKRTVEAQLYKALKIIRSKVDARKK